MITTITNYLKRIIQEAVQRALSEQQSTRDDPSLKLLALFSNNKSRGSLGEVSLRSLLNDYLPGRFQEQVPLGGGYADFVVDGTFVIDSKFLLQEANESLKKRLENSAKAITRYSVDGLPVFLYVPTESLYLEAQEHYASVYSKYNVIIVGPSVILSVISVLQVINKKNALKVNADATIRDLRDFDKVSLDETKDFIAKVRSNLDKLESSHEKTVKAISKIKERYEQHQ